ncbi:MAG: DUF5334 family protein [Pseudomonadota bacterium]
MSTHFPKNIILITAFFLINAADCFAWTGYDHSGGSEIEISSGNLVREGETIKFYDWNNDEDRNAEVREVDYLFSSTRLEIYDYIEQKVRVFDMDN